MTRFTVGRVLIVTASAVVVLAVIVALRFVGSPADERIRQTDRRRVEDLQAIGYAQQRYWVQYSQLAPSLDLLGAEGGPPLSLQDPVTGTPYEYRVVDATTYELCARFDRNSTDSMDAVWRHGAGRQCFRREPSHPPK